MTLSAKVQFYILTAYQLEISGGLTTSDAQGILDAADDLYEESFSKGLTPLETAELVLKSAYGA